MSRIIDIAGAMVAELNGGTFSKPFQAVRYYKPTFDLKDMKELHVSVVPKGTELSIANRSLAQADIQIDIGVQQKLTSNEPTEIDALMQLVEEIADFLRTHPLTTCPSASWVGAENKPIYSPEHLEQLRQFTSVLTLTYRVLHE
jgi:hypothetical protein